MAKGLWDAVREDCEKFAQIYCEAAAKAAADKIFVYAHDAIASFYADYDPKVYRRTYNLGKNSYRRYYKNAGRGYYYGGVEIDSAFMDDYKRYNPYVEKVEDGQGAKFSTKGIVALSAWVYGYHGWPSDYVKQTSPSPLEYLKNIATTDNPVLMREINDIASSEAAKGSYSVITVSK